MFTDVCSLRLDFEQFNLLAGATTVEPQACQDSMTVSDVRYISIIIFKDQTLKNYFFQLASVAVVPVICGKNDGEHSKLHPILHISYNFTFSIIF